MHAVVRLGGGEEWVAGYAQEDAVDEHGDGDCSEQVGDGDDELGVGDGAQAGHVIFLRIFHGVDQRGGCRGGHFGGEQETAGLHEQELRAAATNYVQEFVLERIFPEMASLLATLRNAGVELWAVSSTNRWVVAEGVREFGIAEERILAAEVRVVDGVISSEIVAVPTDALKAEALKKAGLPAPDVVFGNSIHDLAMLEIAHKAFPVNPSPALLQAARKHGWGYFQPAAATGAETAVGGE